MAKALSIDPAVLAHLRKLPRRERVEHLLVLCDLLEAFGRPHAHGGLGVRKLGAGLFECRVGLGKRFVFQDRREELFVFFCGSHDEVGALLRRQR
ncbi:hypothetical protein L6Q96_16995 [Candidatus Binatia bacterium]|nr:hypothetical protein [Candidatus Binatia bacterium]